jgi:hypothetical protein
MPRLHAVVPILDVTDVPASLDHDVAVPPNVDARP